MFKQFRQDAITKEEELEEEYSRQLTNEIIDQVNAQYEEKTRQLELEAQSSITSFNITRTSNMSPDSPDRKSERANISQVGMVFNRQKLKCKSIKDFFDMAKHNPRSLDGHVLECLIRDTILKEFGPLL